MRRAFLLVGLLSLAMPATAQVLNAPASSAPGAAAPAAPGQEVPAQPPAAQAQPAPATPLSPPPPPASWQPQQLADLVALDKVGARNQPFTLQIGHAVEVGSLTITLRACLARPPDEPADSAAFLDITDSHPGFTPFHGWIIASNPALNMFEHPGYDVTLRACHN